MSLTRKASDLKKFSVKGALTLDSGFQSTGSAWIHETVKTHRQYGSGSHARYPVRG